MRSEKILMVTIRPGLFKRAMKRQGDAWSEIKIDQTMISLELSDRGLRSKKNRVVMHKYYCDKTGSVMPYKVFWGKYIYLSDIMVK